MPLPHIIAGHIILSSTVGVTGGMVAARVYKNYTQRQARMRGYEVHEDGFLVQVTDDEFWVSREDIEAFRGFPKGQLLRYRVAPMRHHGFKIGWMEGTH